MYHDARINKRQDLTVISNILQDPYVRTFLSVVERHCKLHHLMMHGDFSVDHPVEEVGRLLMALLIKHQGLGFQVIALIDQGKNGISIANNLGSVDVA